MAGLVGEIYFNEPKELIMGGRWGDEDICKGEGLIIIKTTPHFVFFKSNLIKLVPTKPAPPVITIFFELISFLFINLNIYLCK